MLALDLIRQHIKIKRWLIRLPTDKHYFVFHREQLEELVEQLHHADRDPYEYRHYHPLN